MVEQVTGTSCGGRHLLVPPGCPRVGESLDEVLVRTLNVTIGERDTGRVGYN